MEWIFGYGSLIWRPGFEWTTRHRAHVIGWTRRFWQGSPDHRGTPEHPGRVVTLVPDITSMVHGVAFRVEPKQWTSVVDYLDVRESGGYTRLTVEVNLANGSTANALTYVAHPDNPNYLGADDPLVMAEHIARSVGPSGENLDYLVNLWTALKHWDIDDPHVDVLVRSARSFLARERP
ncbi:MAG: gamma-glutamylcyclotransferase [Myxococcota bacterium]|nr:gamma-glutamylcyclotransferase [Myxococcota bacterium]